MWNWVCDVGTVGLDDLGSFSKSHRLVFSLAMIDGGHWFGYVPKPAPTYGHIHSHRKLVYFNIIILKRWDLLRFGGAQTIIIPRPQHHETSMSEEPPSLTGKGSWMGCSKKQQHGHVAIQKNRWYPEKMPWFVRNNDAIVGGEWLKQANGQSWVSVLDGGCTGCYFESLAVGI